jgi:prevent-host-death family protein
MTVTVSVEEASGHFPELLSRLSEGADEIVISRDGTPVARLLPAREEVAPRSSRRSPGEDAGLFLVPQQFFDPLPDDILDQFYDGALRS